MNIRDMMLSVELTPTWVVGTVDQTWREPHATQSGKRGETIGQPKTDRIAVHAVLN